MSSLARSPQIIAALIAGAVSLLIAVGSGLYVLRKMNRRIENLRDEMLDAAKTKRFVEAVDKFRVEFRKYETIANELSGARGTDDTALIQHVIAFYGETARHFYDENKQFLDGEKLNILSATITRDINSGRLNEHTDPNRQADPNRMVFLQALTENIVQFCRSLYDDSLKY